MSESLSSASQESPRVVESAPASLSVDTRRQLRSTRQADLEQLTEWLSDPTVYEHWGQSPVSRDTVAAKYLGKRGPSVRCYVIEDDLVPVGFIQAWQEDGSAGLDMFISPLHRGEGIGPVVANALATDLMNRGWPALTVDPSLRNTSAIRAWRKAGFIIDRDAQIQPDVVLMRFERSSNA